MSYKFAHLADVHWRGLSRHQEYRASFEDAFAKMRAERPDAIFVVGDIVHSKTQGISPELISNLSWWFRELDSIAPTFVSLGNHDGLITNPDREDAVSPIINALSLDRLKLLKGTRKFSYDERIDVTNFCPFDPEGWGSVGPTPGKMNIALFHGPVLGCSSDDDWVIDADIDISIFDSYDFVMLGDIHKRQVLGKGGRILYCGSTIQQNYGESSGKGFSIWDIESSNEFSHKHVEVKHDSPFVTLDWPGSIGGLLHLAEEHPKGARIRVRTDEPIGQADIKQLHAALREQRDANEIVFKFDTKKEIRPTDFDASAVEAIDFRDPNSLANLILEYHSEQDLSEELKGRIVEQAKHYSNRLERNDAKANGRWSIKKLDFDNTFGYGKGNSIDFDNLDGITGLFGQNRVGKSSICGTLMYSLFNSTDRGSMPNLHVINSRKGHCRADLTFEKNGILYRIERQTVRKENRKGEVSGVTNLNLYEVDEGGNVIRDLCDEQRRETDKVLREIIGTSEDFLLTSFAAQGEMNTFIEQKATLRKNILSRFLELEVFDQIHEMVKVDCSGFKYMVKNLPSKDFDTSIREETRKLDMALAARAEHQSSLQELRDSIQRLEISFHSRDDGGKYTPEELAECENSLSVLRENSENAKVKIDAYDATIADLEAKIHKIEELRNNFPIEDLKESLKEFRLLETRVTSVKHETEKEKQTHKVLAKQVEVLNDVPCGDEYPTCPFIVNAHKAKSSLKKSNQRLEELSCELDELKSRFRKDTIQDLESKLEKYDDFLNKQNKIRIEKGSIELKRSEAMAALVKLESSIKAASVKAEEMRANLSTDDAVKQLQSIRNDIESLKKDERKAQERLMVVSESIGLAQSNITKLQDECNKIKQAVEQYQVFELIQQAVSKNGIPLNVVRQKLPIINAEIASILQNVTGFTVELESPDGSNDMEVYINYGDSKRIIECGSGMEKMMASLAIRVALSNVSSLPKSDIFIIDEGFGALDANNVEACNRFLQSLKKWFRCILIISHVDAVKDAVDNVLVIERHGEDAKIK